MAGKFNQPTQTPHLFYNFSTTYRPQPTLAISAEPLRNLGLPFDANNTLSPTGSLPTPTSISPFSAVASPVSPFLNPTLAVSGQYQNAYIEQQGSPNGATYGLQNTGENYSLHVDPRYIMASKTDQAFNFMNDSARNISPFPSANQHSSPVNTSFQYIFNGFPNRSDSSLVPGNLQGIPYCPISRTYRQSLLDQHSTQQQSSLFSTSLPHLMDDPCLSEVRISAPRQTAITSDSFPAVPSPKPSVLTVSDHLLNEFNPDSSLTTFDGNRQSPHVLSAARVQDPCDNSTNQPEPPLSSGVANQQTIYKFSSYNDNFGYFDGGITLNGEPSEGTDLTNQSPQLHQPTILTEGVTCIPHSFVSNEVEECTNTSASFFAPVDVPPRKWISYNKTQVSKSGRIRMKGERMMNAPYERPITSINIPPPTFQLSTANFNEPEDNHTTCGWGDCGKIVSRDSAKYDTTHFMNEHKPILDQILGFIPGKRQENAEIRKCFRFRCIWRVNGGEICGREMAYTSLKRHFATEHLPLSTTAPCPNCGKVLALRSHYQHMKSNACKFMKFVAVKNKGSKAPRKKKPVSRQ